MQTTDLQITEKYLVFPVSRYADPVPVRFLRKDRLVFDADLRLDADGAERAFLDLSAFSGETLSLALPDGMACAPVFASRGAPRVGPHRYRPEVHFTPDRGWMNDPNGLVFYRGAWHMFYQHNPYGRAWGNMHWGHAVSRDLVHWEEQPIALYPDELGTMFSGSAVVDTRNDSGLREGDDDPILLFYTAAGGTGARSEGKPFVQCMAWSSDGGRTFRKYAQNPVLGHVEAQNRDPKVIRCEELSCWLMAIYLDGDRYALYRSDDLRSFRPYRVLPLAEDAECPDFFPLCADGDPARRFWILTGASHRFAVYAFRDGELVEVQGSRPFAHSHHCYASQTFSDVPDGRRISLGWGRDLPFGDAPFQGQMSLPLELSLRSGPDGYALCAVHARECGALVRERTERTDAAVGPDAPLSLPLSGRACRIFMDVRGVGTAVRLHAWGRKIVIDPAAGEVRADKYRCPLKSSLCVTLDAASAEILCDGTAELTVPFSANYSYTALTLTAEAPVSLPSITLERLAL